MATNMTPTNVLLRWTECHVRMQCGNAETVFWYNEALSPVLTERFLRAGKCPQVNLVLPRVAHEDINRRSTRCQTHDEGMKNGCRGHSLVFPP